MSGRSSLAGMTPDQRQALENFAVHLSPGAKVLYAPAGSVNQPQETQTPLWLRSHGFEVEELDPSKDLRFLSLKKESYDGVWSGRALGSLSIEEVQRVTASFFLALRPRTGMLFLAYPLAQAAPEAQGANEPGFQRDGFASMLRQNGYQTLNEGLREQSGTSWIALIARRL
jgi:hypothetical protein